MPKFKLNLNGEILEVAGKKVIINKSLIAIITNLHREFKVFEYFTNILIGSGQTEKIALDDAINYYNSHLISIFNNN